MNRSTMETNPTGKTFSLLYVEDEQLFREVLSRSLLRRFPGIRVELAKNGAQGLNMFKELRPNMVITGIALPVMSGADMATKIRALCPKTVIIFLTDVSDEGILRRLSMLTPVGFLNKLFVFKRLFDLVDACMLMDSDQNS